MSTAKYIGRVGGLAVALGVGIAVANSPAVAFAEPTDSATSASESSASESSASQAAGAKSADPVSQIRSAVTDALNRDRSATPRRSPHRPAGTMAVRSSGGAHTSSFGRHDGGTSRTDVVDVVRAAADTLRKPAARTTPDTPAPPPAPAAWTLAAFARREFEPATLSRNLTNTPAGLSVVTAAPPSAMSKLVTATARTIRAVEKSWGVDIIDAAYAMASSDNPPRLVTAGLNVTRSEFNGWTVWELSPANPSGKYVVASHAGAYVLKASTVLEWPHLAAMARNTGATVVVPIYPLAPQGTAATVVPQMADLISYEIDQHGAENVSVYGISAGGGLTLTAVQEIVRRGDPVPSHMVLISPTLDLSLTNPGIPLVDDPLISESLMSRGLAWAGDLDFKDPMVSGLYGSLEGLPPTVVYVGTVDVVYPDVLLLQDKAASTTGADFTFVVGEGQLHAWPALGILPDAKAVVPDIYEQLGLIDS